MLEVSGLAFGYGRRRVGAGLDLTVRAGEVLCLLGPNGGGKTTLFKTLLGLLPPLAGAIRLDGEDVARWSRRRLAARLGYVPQAQGATFPFRVSDVVLMGRASRLGPFASPGPADRAIAARALASLEIAHLAERAYTEISGGERQMVLIARALAGEPRILVMDEPTASLDFGNQGLVIVGVHTPEFSFERDTANVQAAIARHGIGYPVAQDNGFRTWSAYRNQYWPAVYLIDREGRVVFKHVGDADQEAVERKIQEVLRR